MSYIKVKNKKSTSDKVPPDGSGNWLEFWEKQKHAKASQCEVFGCRGKPEVGGHVIKAGDGGKEYILPICKACNNKPDGEVFEAWENDLVSVK